MEDNKKFQVNLEGIISLLSESLYANQSVFLREVLQNAVDAITARKKIDAEFEETITFDLLDNTLVIEDNGIGLSKEDVENFLSVIGQSSKRNKGELLNNDFIGKFGIGLLSCFIVCDEITILTRKVDSDDVYKWVGKNDGTYTLKKSDISINYGTRVYLKAKEDCFDFFDYDYVKDTLCHYGGFLPYNIILNYRNEMVKINKNIYNLLNDEEDSYNWLLLGREVFKEDFLDCIPIKSKAADIKGVAYILSSSMNIISKVKGKVYVKGMFVSEQCDKLMPSWASFTRPLIDVRNIKLTASREDFFEDETLVKIREEIEESIEAYFVNLYERNPKKLEKIIGVHHNTLKLMSAEEDKLYKIMIKYFKFETTMGNMTLFEVYNKYKTIRYTVSIDDYKQIEKTARAQEICIVNGGYLRDMELIEKFNFLVDKYVTELITPEYISEYFSELSFQQMQETSDFIDFADEVLKSHMCKACIKSFKPFEMPVVYNISGSVKMMKNIKDTKEESIEENNFMLAELASSFEEYFEENLSELCFNYNNPFVKKLIDCTNNYVKKSVIEILYVQSLMIGHHKISKEENQLFTNGINNIMDMVL